MSDILTYVYVNYRGQDIPIGRLWSYFNNGKESASFKYDESWLKNPENFELEPYLPLTEGTFHTDAKKSIFASFSDCSPDSWGRLLIKQNEEKLAEKENRARRRLNQIDYLLAVYDFSRHGALRFKQTPDGEFLSARDSKSIPPLVELPKLLASSEKILDNDASYNDIRELLAPGSSLGGARPKASVIDKEGNLCIAKFPKKDDNNNNVLWEAVALTLAQKAGLNVQHWKLTTALGKAVLLLRRFDRTSDGQRIPFLSAMSMLNANDGDSNEYSYLDLAEIIRTKGVNVTADMKELWHRMLFSVLISNTDDHLRNHGFLKNNANGWQLSPLYDVNPSCDRTGNLQLNIDENSSAATVEMVMSVAEYVRLNKAEAEKSLDQPHRAVSKWRNIAQTLGIGNGEIARMSAAFEK